MAEASGEQDKSEEASPHKLEKARQRGMIPRGTDLGFLAVLIGLAMAAQATGADLLSGMMVSIRRSWAISIAHSANPDDTVSAIVPGILATLQPLVVAAFILFFVVVVVEVIQVRGIRFTAAPLKPDFSKLNPAKGLKRLLSMRMLKELAKSIFKLALYASGAFLLIRSEVRSLGSGIRSSDRLAEAMLHAAGRLLILFLAISAAVAILDQVIARTEFAKQMRMSRRELTREVREREGEPRQKRRRKQIMAEMLKQAAAAANVKGADVLIVNPVHYAVALSYRSGEQAAPVLVAAGRNRWARQMRTAAERHGVVIIRNPRLARSLFHGTKVGQPIGQSDFVAVADIYIMLRRATAGAMPTAQAPTR